MQKTGASGANPAKVSIESMVQLVCMDANCLTLHLVESTAGSQAGLLDCRNHTFTV